MKAEILSIGDEVLIGQTINTNAAFIGHRLTEIGIEVRYITVVGDNEPEIMAALSIADQRADVIISTGGLGPTHDDITKQVFAKFYQMELILNQSILKYIKDNFEKRGLSMPAVNEVQAYIPEGATVIENHAGTAPGLIIHKNGKYIFVLPGVPMEMEWMMERTVLPFLWKKAKKIILYKTIRTMGIGESALFEKIDDIHALEKIVKIAFLPQTLGADIRLLAVGESQAECISKIARVESVIREKVEDYIWGTDRDTMEGMVAVSLLKNHQRLSIAESCTGGAIIHRFADSEQSSNFLSPSVVLSSQEAIVTTLGVSVDIVNEYGIRSEQIAQEMARQVRSWSQADYGLATTGSLTSQATAGADFGYVHIAIADHTGMTSQKYMLKILNKQRAVIYAINFLRRHLLNRR